MALAVEQTSPEPEEEERLLTAYALGDREAFTQLVGLIGSRLYGFVCRFLRDACLAEDVYQEILVKLAKNASGFDRRAKFNTWLYRIARNACLDELRKKKRGKTLNIDNPDDRRENGLETLPSDTPPPDERATMAELGKKIAEAVANLPEEQREVFLLKEDGGLTFAEIAETLGCGLETVKSRMRYALARLRSALAREARLFGMADKI
jgi:RNA polymerase sigma-70 factor (ECF subfamily)